MAFSLPSYSFLARNQIDVVHMNEVLRNWTMLPTRKEAIARAEEQMSENLAIRSVQCYVLLSDDAVALVEIGPRDRFTQLHRFGHA